MKPIMVNGVSKLIQPKSYYDYENMVMPQIQQFVLDNDIKPIGEQVNMKCVYYRGDKRRCDLTNLVNATADLLVKGGVLEDDNYRILRSMDGSTVFYDKENPRVEITITPATKKYQKLIM